MRLGIKSSNDFIQTLNKKNNEIQTKYQDITKELTKPVSIKVMLGDGTVNDQKTFDPNLMKSFYEKILKNLNEWIFQDVSLSNNEDLRRIFTKFEIREGNYLLSVHLSIQFHVLLYYKPVNRVIECQKELSRVIEQTKNGESDLANLGDQLIVNKLKELGYEGLNNQEIFELFFENDELREKIYNQVEKKTDTDFKEMEIKKTELFNELDSYLIETYQIIPALIDDTRLVGGEEGCLCTFDLEFIKNKTKIGLFDPKRIPAEIQTKILYRLDQIAQIMKLCT